MSFLGFTVNTYGDLMDKKNSRLIQRGIMTRELYQGLKLNGVELFAQCTNWNRYYKFFIFEILYASLYVVYANI